MRAVTVTTSLGCFMATRGARRRRSEADAASHAAIVFRDPTDGHAAACTVLGPPRHMIGDEANQSTNRDPDRGPHRNGERAAALPPDVTTAERIEEHDEHESDGNPEDRPDEKECPTAACHEAERKPGGAYSEAREAISEQDEPHARADIEEDVGHDERPRAPAPSQEQIAEHRTHRDVAQEPTEALVQVVRPT
jgi:hypothetical protein